MNHTLYKQLSPLGFAEWLEKNFETLMSLDEWNDKEVLIISPEPTEKGCYIAYEEIDFIDMSLDLVWHCELSKLKLIYRP